MALAPVRQRVALATASWYVPSLSRPPGVPEVFMWAALLGLGMLGLGETFVPLGDSVVVL